MWELCSRIYPLCLPEPAEAGDALGGGWWGRLAAPVGGRAGEAGSAAEGLGREAERAAGRGTGERGQRAGHPPPSPGDPQGAGVLGDVCVLLFQM